MLSLLSKLLPTGSTGNMFEPFASKWREIRLVSQGRFREMKNDFSFARLVLLSFAACAASFAQSSTSQINGAVHDPSGLAVPGAQVTATQTATGAVRMTTTG